MTELRKDQRVRFPAGDRTRTGVIQRIWGNRAVNVSILTDDEAPGQSFVRLAGDVEVIGEGED